MSSDNLDRLMQDLFHAIVKWARPYRRIMPPDVLAEMARIDHQLLEFKQARQAQLQMLGLEGFVTV